VKTILLATAALAVLTGCQSAVEKQRLEEADSGDLPNCARIREVSGGCGRKATTTQIMPLPTVASSLSGAEAAEPALLLSAAKC